MEICLQEGLSCNTVAEGLGVPSSSLDRWVRQARIDQGQAGTRDQGLLTSDERAELNRLRKEVDINTSRS
ncbi:transposase [Cyanobium sp. LEGE 06143]|uniref:transposase n=1 Tax=Cyanobium sp. LEGE 06143 TaxID=945727 RepID=UPI001880410B|nr:transposase [Cyanobium sp. LEGE 06143]